MTNPDSEPPPLDADLARRLLGKHLLVGLTYVRQSSEVIELHGIVEQVNRHEGIVIRLSDGSEYKLPPDLLGVREAPAGSYRLRSTGEEVQDPDFLCKWTIMPPDSSKAGDAER